MKFNFSFIKEARSALARHIESLSEEERQKLISYIYITLTLFTISFFGFFAIAPTLATITNLNKQYRDNKLVYDALNKKLSNLQLLDFQYREIQPDLKLIYSAIPRNTQIPQLTRQLENIARNNNVSITRLSFGIVEIFPNNTRTSPIYSFTFTINLSGDESSANNFLIELINFNRIIGIERITTGKGDDNRYATSITGRTYFSDK